MQVYTRLNHLGICTSYQHSLRLLDQWSSRTMTGMFEIGHRHWNWRLYVQRYAINSNILINSRHVANPHYAFYIQSSESRIQPPSAVLADSAPHDGTMDMHTILQWLDHDDSASDTSDEEESIRNITPISDISDGSASSEGELSVELPTSEIPPAEEGTACPMDQSAPRDSTVAGTPFMHIRMLLIIIVC